MRNRTLIAAAVIALIGPLVAQAQEVTLDLGASSQNFTEYGFGANGAGDGTYTMGQGACVTGTSTTCTLSGSYTSTVTGIASGTYSFVTTYAGSDTPTGGPNAPKARSETPGGIDGNYFNYSGLAASTSMTLTLDETGGQTLVEALVTNGHLDPNANFSFLFTGDIPADCTGTAVSKCNPFTVGITPGAVFSAPVTIAASFGFTATTPPPPPPPPPPVPEPASLLLFAMGLAGLGLNRRKRTS